MFLPPKLHAVPMRVIVGAMLQIFHKLLPYWLPVRRASHAINAGAQHLGGLQRQVNQHTTAFW